MLFRAPFSADPKEAGFWQLQRARLIRRRSRFLQAGLSSPPNLEAFWLQTLFTQNTSGTEIVRFTASATVLSHGIYVMNVRVSVIILAAAIFMAVWDADQKAMEKDRVQIARQRASQQALIVEKTSSASETSHSDSVAASSRESTHSVTAAAAKTPVAAANSGFDCIPLPARLAAGTWQVTNDQGQESRITIHSTPAANETEQSFCIITTENGRRWCFVKLPDFSRSASLTNDSSVR